MTDLKPIETRYAGCLFRSRLEARWAVFFDTLGIEWQYEPQGFRINGKPYLPDFLLETGTWIEVKGDAARVDKPFLMAAAQQLPAMDRIEWPGPKLLILGPVPKPRADSLPPRAPCSCGVSPERDRALRLELEGGDWGWIGLERRNPEGHYPVLRYGFGLGWSRPGTLADNQLCRPCNLPPYQADEQALTRSDWTVPAWHPGTFNCAYAYAAARSARFEHGQSGALPPPPGQTAAMRREALFESIMRDRKPPQFGGPGRWGR